MIIIIALKIIKNTFLVLIQKACDSLYKCLYGFAADLDVSDFVSFLSHGRTRLSNSYNLKTPVCKT